MTLEQVMHQHEQGFISNSEFLLWVLQSNASDAMKIALAMTVAETLRTEETRDANKRLEAAGYNLPPLPV